MDRATLLHVKSTILHCPPSIITRQRASVDSKLLGRPRNVGFLLPLYLNDNAQTPLGRFIVYVIQAILQQTRWQIEPRFFCSRVPVVSCTSVLCPYRGLYCSPYSSIDGICHTPLSYIFYASYSIHLVKYPCTEQGRWRNVIAKNRKYTQKINCSLYVLIDRLFAYVAWS